jgi:hypothetical protein
MSGYYVPSSFSANYINNKKSEDGTYVYDQAINEAGIGAQRSLQQLNKQYNVTINNAYSQHLLANKGLQASNIGTGYKEAFTQQLQNAAAENLQQTATSVQNVKQDIFSQLGSNLQQINTSKLQEINNMRRMASSLEQYHNYLQPLTKGIGGSKYTEDNKFKVGNEWTFEDNYNQLFDTQKGIVGNYVDEENNVGLSWEDWLRKNSGNSATDTAWLDWVYGGGADQFKNFIGYKSSLNTPESLTPEPPAAIEDKKTAGLLTKFLDTFKHDEMKLKAILENIAKLVNDPNFNGTGS